MNVEFKIVNYLDGTEDDRRYPNPAAALDDMEALNEAYRAQPGNENDRQVYHTAHADEVWDGKVWKQPL